MPPSVTRDWVVRRRLATQRLTGAPLPRAVDAVRLLTAVQSQDAPLAHFSLGLRTRRGTYAAGLAEQATGTFTRTHVLRPTWHFVAAEDLRWLQRLTAAKVTSSLTARRRGLDLEPATLARQVDRVVAVLAAGPRTRRDLQTELARRGEALAGQRLAHTLMAAELDALVCGGPPHGTEHTYVLADEAIPPGPLDDLPRDEAIRLLTHRFLAGHGPADERDLQRWCTLTLGEIRPVIASLEADGTLERVLGEGLPLWFDPSVRARATRRVNPPTALLLSTFDEATLTYPRTGFPRLAESLDRSRVVAEAGGGSIILTETMTDIGLWKRTSTPGGVDVRIRPERPLSPAATAAVEAAVAELGAHLERPATTHWAP